MPGRISRNKTRTRDAPSARAASTNGSTGAATLRRAPAVQSAATRWRRVTARARPQEHVPAPASTTSSTMTRGMARPMLITLSRQRQCAMPCCRPQVRQRARPGPQQQPRCRRWTATPAPACEPRKNVARECIGAEPVTGGTGQCQRAASNRIRLRGSGSGANGGGTQTRRGAQHCAEQHGREPAAARHRVRCTGSTT